MPLWPAYCWHGFSFGRPVDPTPIDRCLYGQKLDAKYIEHVCFTNWTSTCAATCFTTLEDQIVKSVVDECGVAEAARSYRYARQTLAAVSKGIMKYDHPVLEEPPGFDLAYQKCLRFLSPIIRPTRPLHAVDLPANTSPGAQIKKAGIGWKTKRDYCVDAGEYLDQYLNHGLYATERVIWSVSGKVELKTMKKLREEDIRLFLVPPVHFLLLQDTHCGDLDGQFKAMANDPEQPIKIGMVPQYGGFQAQLEHLKKKFRYFVSSDVVKFDGKFARFLMRLVYRLRIELQDAAFGSDILKFCLQVLTNPELLLPTGEIVRMLQGHLSGSGTTGHDGSLGHLLFVFWMCLVLGLEYGVDVQAIIGADDIVLASKRPIPLKARVWCYAQVGWELKLDEDIMRGNTLDGVSFYGMTYHETVDGGYPEHSKLDKVASALLQLESTKAASPNIIIDKIVNLRSYCAFDDAMWHFCERVMQAYAARLDWDDVVVPSRQHYKNVLWSAPRAFNQRKL